MKSGEIWRVRLAGGPGHKQAGERPAIVLQEESLVTALPTALVVPLTGTSAANRFPGTLIVQPDEQNGLTMPSIALVFQFGALDKRDCLYRVGKVNDETLTQIFALLDQLMGR